MAIQWWYAVLILIAIALFAVLAWMLRYRYAGCGMTFRQKKDGSWWVVARLLGSPAHRAKIDHGAELIEYKGAKVAGMKPGALRKLLPARRGEVVKCTVRQHGQELKAVMIAETIQGPIPDYSDSTVLPDHDGDTHQGMAVCQRTGQWVPTSRLTGEAFRRIFG